MASARVSVTGLYALGYPLHVAGKPEKLDAAVVAQFDDLDIANGDALIVFGWAMAEDLEKLL